MFVKLRNRFVLTVMVMTTAILAVAFTLIYSISAGGLERRQPMVTVMRERPTSVFGGVSDEMSEIILQVQAEREAYLAELLWTLIMIGVAIEAVIFVATMLMAEQAIRPVKDAYMRQKDFVASASHELKTPLAVVSTNFEALQAENKLEGPWAENISLGLAQANQEVSDLLVLAQAEEIVGGKIEEVDVSRMMNKHLKLLRAQTDGRLEIEEKVPSNVKVKLVRADLEKIVSILLDNAAKYAEKKIVVRLDKRGLTVSNDGTKIPADKLERIFEKFYQVDKTAKGSGLGLAIAKAVAERNHWNLSVSSGKLTTFQLGFRNTK